MFVVPEWKTPEEIERDVPAIAQLRQYWESLNGGMPPERTLIDPEAIKGLLPFMMLVDFEWEPFRVRYRLTGTRIDEMTGYNLTGRYLNVYFTEPFSDGAIRLHQAYERVARTGLPHIDSYQWSNHHRMPFGIFPLSVRGEVTQAIAIEQPYGPTPLQEMKTWKEYLSIHQAGGPSELEPTSFR